MLSKLISIVGYAVAATILISLCLVGLKPPNGERHVKPVPALVAPEGQLEQAVKRAERAAEQAEEAQLRVAESKVVPALPLPSPQQEFVQPLHDEPIRNRFGSPLGPGDVESMRDHIFRTQGMEIK